MADNLGLSDRGQPDRIVPRPPRADRTENSHPPAWLGPCWAALLLAAMCWLMVSGALEDAVTYDEQPHVAAGYTYLTRRTVDFNTEHPPLLKDLAALPLLFMKLDLSWEKLGDDPNWFNGDPWEFGRKLLDHSTGDPDRAMFAVRAPIIALTLLLGWALFAWTRRRYGDVAGVIALTLYVFSPTILAHGRLVTTDLGAAAGFFIATIMFLRFLERPSGANVLLAGTALGLALLTKFSTILLVPIFIVLAVAWHLLIQKRARPLPESVLGSLTPLRKQWGSPIRWTRRTLLIAIPSFAKAWRQAWRKSSEVAPSAARVPRLTAARVAGVICAGFLFVYAFYAHHLGNMPQERQLERAKFSLTGRGVGNTPKDLVLWAARKPLLRPWAAYFAGVIQTMIRSAQGNGPYLLGEFHTQGVRKYFPAVYLMKEPAALHVLSVIAILSALTGLFLLRGMPLGWRGMISKSLRLDFAPAAMLFVLAVYWLVSIRSNLNIGVRHLLPVLPFTYVLVARELREFAVRLPLAMNLRENFIVHTGLVLIGYFGFVAALLGWQVSSVLRVHPYHMAYFNEFAGGPENGWRNAVDSNADWGQDMGRLAQFVEQRGIEKLALDYFGSADANRYLPGKWEAINTCFPPRHGWVAVSVMSYQSSTQNPACDYRRWIPLENLTAKVGYSTLIFHVE
ncbi:MAG: glycosyltransferase family 39 protein [Acidobacteria bacterium]|nr:glycosyltransferase family 39 protein [Acidobacteriota bacterium]